MTTLLQSPLPPTLLPGQKRHVDALLADPLMPLPTPAGEALTRIVAVHEVCPPGERYAPGVLEFLTLFLTLHGRAQVQVGSGSFAHQPGSLVAVASGCRIAEEVAMEQPWQVYYLHITGSWADQMDGWLRRQDPAILVCPAVSTHRRRVFTELADLALAQPSGWAWLFLSRCAELLGGLYADAAAAPAERPSVAQMAASLQLTPRQLIYQFGKAAGEPRAAWIRRRRVAAARRLLSQGRSVSSVAEHLGYANPYHFSRVFKAVTGESPSTARANGLAIGLHVREESSRDQGGRRENEGGKRRVGTSPTPTGTVTLFDADQFGVEH